MIAKIPPEVEGFLQKNHQQILADSSLTDAEVVLLSVYMLEGDQNSAGVEKKQCEDLFVELGRPKQNFPVVLSRLTSQKQLMQNSKIYFSSVGLTAIQNLLHLVQKKPVFIIKSGSNFSATKLFEQFVEKNLTDKSLDICDSYVSAESLFPFTSVTGTTFTKIRLLTMKINDEDKFKSYAKKMISEHKIVLEVRLNNRLHDRYLINGKNIWTIGTSINGIGNKDAILREANDAYYDLKLLFEERWGAATNYPL